MNKLFKLSLVITLICFGASIHGMKRKNETDLIVQNSNDTNQIQAALNQIQESSWLPQEIIAHIAGYCWPKEKNILMRVCKSFEACLKNRQLILQENPATVGMTDKVDALIEYAHDGDVIMTKFLLDNGVNVNYNNCLGIRPFHDAHENVMPLLIERGASVHESKPQIHRLHEAVYAGDEETVKRLLASKTNPNIALSNGVTPLYIATAKGYTEIVKLLLTTDGIEVNKAAIDGSTLLLIASNFGHIEIVKLLLASGAEVDKAINDDYPPLHSASANGHTEIVQLLLAAGAEVNKVNKNGTTPLYFASQNGHTEIVKLLLAANGIEVNKANKDGVVPLHIASNFGYIEIVKLLLAAGAEVNKAVNNEITPLYIASQNGHTEIVKLLLAANRIDVNKATFDGGTPLLIASYFGHIEVVQLLLNKGANIHTAVLFDSENVKKGDTALDIARKKGHIQVVELLKSELQRRETENRLLGMIKSGKDIY